MDLDEGTNTLDKLDGFLTKLGTVLKKHWGKLLLLGIGVVCWWVGKEILNEYDNIKEMESESYYDEYYDDGTYQEDYEHELYDVDSLNH